MDLLEKYFTIKLDNYQDEGFTDRSLMIMAEFGGRALYSREVIANYKGDVELAKKENCQYAVDIYPFYGSDVGAALHGGNDIKGALIGPGVAASHGMERTHLQAIESTIKLMLAYLK